MPRINPVNTYYAALSATNVVVLTFACSELNAPVIERTKMVMTKSKYPKMIKAKLTPLGQGPFPGPSSHGSSQ